MKRLLLSCLLAFVVIGANAQFDTHYQFKAYGGTFTSIQGTGTHPTLLAGGTADDGVAENLPIGFIFNYDGKNYTEISLATNGIAQLGPSFQGGSGSGNGFDQAFASNVLAPLWDDLDLTAISNLSYQTSGIAPNRILTVEWTNAKWSYAAASAGISFQIKLYETTNIVEFIYRQEIGAYAPALSGAGATIGISGDYTGVLNPYSYNYIALLNTTASPALSSTDFGNTKLLNTKPATGQVYQFVPASTATFSGHYNFTAVGGTFTSIQGTGTHPTLLAGGTADDGVAENLPIGFIFNYDGKNYTEISLATNGIAQLGPSFQGGSGSGNGFDQAFASNVLAPLWDDLDLTAISNLSYQTSGIAPNRILTVEWTNAKWSYAAASAGISFQIKLYETTNIVEFIYRQEIGAYAPALSGAGATIGISGDYTGVLNPYSYNYIALLNTTASPALSSTDFGNTKLLNTKPAMGQVYRFTPVGDLTFASKYLFNPTTTTFISIQGTGTHPPLTLFTGGGASTDEGFSNAIPIGFNFFYNGNSYSSVNACTNGFLRMADPFVIGETTTTKTNDLSNATTASKNVLAPLWDDLDIQSANNLTYQTFGSSPNRTFVIEWTNVKWSAAAGPGGIISFQARLYEGTNKVDFVYRQETNPVNAASASIGINGPNAGVGNYISLANTTGAPSPSSTAENTTLNSKPATDQVYSFYPEASTFASKYTFGATTTTFNSIQAAPGVVHPPLTAIPATLETATQGGFSNNLPLGFTFYYDGIPYTTVNAEAIGYIKFGSGFATTDADNFAPLKSSVISRRIVSALGGNGFNSAPNNISYLTSGSAPNRIFTIEWTDFLFNYQSPSGTVSFQIKLYEGSNRISLIYKKIAAAFGAALCQIGICGSENTDGCMIALQVATASPTTSTTTETSIPVPNNIPATGQVYNFTPTISVLLPVEMASLNATVKDQTVLLNWQTASEQNNKGFNVQRLEGNTWSTIGFVNGAGNSSTPKNYLFTDIPKRAGVIHYRLEQIDLDGKTMVSNVVKVNMGKMNFSVETFPNPAQQQNTISYTVDVESKVIVQLFDNNGKLVSTIVNEKQQPGTYQYMVNVSKFAKGAYHYAITCGKNKLSKMLMVQ